MRKEVLEFWRLFYSLVDKNALLSSPLKIPSIYRDVIKQIQKEIWNLEIDDRKKAFLMDKCGETEFRMTEGSDEFLRVIDLNNDDIRMVIDD